jgi:hypothetical protein
MQCSGLEGIGGGMGQRNITHLIGNEQTDVRQSQAKAG